jgi:hypothetical protein
MDGYKIRAKLALNFPKPVASTEAEEIMMQYARAFAATVECELSNGDLPFEEQELLEKITKDVQALPKKSVRLIGLHVWHKGAVSSGSMLAVKPERHTSPTVPAMPAVSQTRAKAGPSGSFQAATLKPPDGSAATSTSLPEADGHHAGTGGPASLDRDAPGRHAVARNGRPGRAEPGVERHKTRASVFCRYKGLPRCGSAHQ